MLAYKFLFSNGKLPVLSPNDGHKHKESNSLISSRSLVEQIHQNRSIHASDSDSHFAQVTHFVYVYHSVFMIQLEQVISRKRLLVHRTQFSNNCRPKARQSA